MKSANPKKLLFLTLGVCLVALLIFFGPEKAEPPEEPKEPEKVEESPLTLAALPRLPFTDIPAESGCTDLLRYTLHYGYLNGVSTESFAPYEIADRATAIIVLYRMSGEKAPAYDGRFTDVAANAWYAEAVAWGIAAGIVNGVTGDSFAPTRPITRSQLAVMLERFASYSGCAVTASGDLSAYEDAALVEPYAVEPMSWVLEHDMYRITVGDELLPNMPVSRLQLAGALVALCAARGDELAAEIIGKLPEKEFVESSLDRDAAQLVVDTAAEKYGAVGVQVAVIENGEVTDTFVYGWATKKTDPMTADHKMRVASLSKVAVGVAAMILCEDGVVDLNESVGTYWGVEAVNPHHEDKVVSLRTLLTHTSTIINAGDNVSRDYNSVRSRLANGYYSSATPGASSAWSYNNYAFGVLGMTLELAADQYLTDVLKDRLFTAMNIDAGFCASELKNTDLLTTLYRSSGAVACSVRTQKNTKNPAYPGASGVPFSGSFTISAADLGKLVALLAEDGIYEGVQLLDAESVARMERVFPLSDGSSQGIPLRYRPYFFARKKIYYHTGSSYGLHNFMSYDPLTGDGVVVLTTGAVGSTDRRNIYNVCSEIATYVYRELKKT